MGDKLKLPVGIDDFEKIRRNTFYYIDKTKLIEQLFVNWGEVNLFTRPRRFGKTLNMSMLKCFFEIGADETLFNGLYISGNRQLCEEHMGKYPVIFLSLKNVEGLTFESAKYQMAELIGREAERFGVLKQSENLSETDKEDYLALTKKVNGKYVIDDDILYASLQTLSELLYKHYGKKTVILIDEYDVPLDKAFGHGYYREMVALIRAVFGKALKTNFALEFAVLTGCLRVSKESIFTGLNNFKILSVTDTRFDEQFGFTDKEVKELLAYYHIENRFEETKRWYDGYHFGNADVYCPWDVINHVDRIKDDANAGPEAYWINTSGNELVKRFVDRAGKTTRNEIERLIAGESIEKHIRLDLTYDEIDNSIDNLWSVLFTTGYLTQTGLTKDGAYKLVIPNREVREVFKLQINEWFKKSIFSNTDRLQAFWKSFEDENTELFNSDREAFYKKMVDAYYTLNEDPRRQLFWVAKPFTPFQEGTKDFEEWNDWFSDDAELGEIIQHSTCATPAFIGLLYTDSYPNYYYICLSDLNPENPIVWSTDHEVFFTDVTNEGALEDFLNKFMTKEEFIDIVKRKLEQ